MKALVVATIKNLKGAIIGFRVVYSGENSTDKKLDVKDMPLKNVISALQGGYKFSNIEINSYKKLVGTNGSLDRYPVLRCNSGNIQLETNPCPVIINRQIERDGEVLGYEIVKLNGELLRYTEANTLKAIERNKIANGKVVNRNGVKYVSSLKGKYDSLEMKKKVESKEDKQQAKSIRIGLNKSNGLNTIEKNTTTEVDNTIAQLDAFEKLTEAQKKVLEKYYAWYSIRVFEDLMSNTTFKTKSDAEIDKAVNDNFKKLRMSAAKIEKIASLKQHHKWRFAGFHDTGKMKGGQCELGHPLRYEYYAVPLGVENANEQKITFGSSCVCDFFEVKEEDRKKIAKIQTILAKEIDDFIESINNDACEEGRDRTRMFNRLYENIQSQEDKVEIFGETAVKFLYNFMKVGLYYPKSLMKYVTGKIMEHGKTEFLSKALPYFSDTLHLIQSLSEEGRNSGGGKFMPCPQTTVIALDDYLHFLCENKLNGAYAYDPFEKSKDTSEGKHDKAARDRRFILLLNLKAYALAENFEYDELVGILTVADKLFKKKVVIDGILAKLKVYPGERRYMTILREMGRIHARLGLEVDNQKRIDACVIVYLLALNAFVEVTISAMETSKAVLIMGRRYSRESKWIVPAEKASRPYRIANDYKEALDMIDKVDYKDIETMIMDRVEEFTKEVMDSGYMYKIQERVPDKEGIAGGGYIEITVPFGETKKEAYQKEVERKRAEEKELEEKKQKSKEIKAEKALESLDNIVESTETINNPLEESLREYYDKLMEYKSNKQRNQLNQDNMTIEFSQRVPNPNKIEILDELLKKMAENGIEVETRYSAVPKILATAKTEKYGGDYYSLSSKQRYMINLGLDHFDVPDKMSLIEGIAIPEDQIKPKSDKAWLGDKPEMIEHIKTILEKSKDNKALSIAKTVISRGEITSRQEYSLNLEYKKLEQGGN